MKALRRVKMYINTHPSYFPFPSFPSHLVYPGLCAWSVLCSSRRALPAAAASEIPTLQERSETKGEVRRGSDDRPPPPSTTAARDRRRHRTTPVREVEHEHGVCTR